MFQNKTQLFCNLQTKVCLMTTRALFTIGCNKYLQKSSFDVYGKYNIKNIAVVTFFHVLYLKENVYNFPSMGWVGH